MIIPTPEFDPLFARDGVPFREKMNAYIAREFADLLGPASPEPPQRGNTIAIGKRHSQPAKSAETCSPRAREAA